MLSSPLVRFTPCYRNIEEQGRVGRIKEIAMTQWINRLRNNIFVNALPLPLLCEISGALHLGLTVGWLAGWLADEIQLIFENFKIHYRSKIDFSLCLTKVQLYYSCTNVFK